MCTIPKVQFGCNHFETTASYAEQSIYRRIAEHGGIFIKSHRAVLIKLVNLWFRWRGRGWFEFKSDDLARVLRLSKRSVQTATAHLRDLNILVLLRGGRGRGHHASYAIDLHRLQQTFAPNAAVKCRGEWVTLDGEIKGAKTAFAYKEEKQYPTPILINLPRRLGWEGLQSALRRVRLNARAWFRAQPSGTSPHWIANNLGTISQ